MKMETYFLKVKEAFMAPAEYGWYDGSNTPVPVMVSASSLAAIEQKQMYGQIRTPDVFILRAVVMLGYATPDMVVKCLKVLRKIEGGEKAIPVPDKGDLVMRLYDLVNMGILYRYCFKIAGEERDIYSISYIGSSFYNHMAGIDYRQDSFDKAYNNIPGMMKMRRLSSSYVTIAYASAVSDMVTKVKSNDIVKFSDGTCILYNRLELKTAEGKEYVLIFEPAFRFFDGSLLSEADNEENLLCRLRDIKRHIDYRRNMTTSIDGEKVARYSGVYLVLLVEDKAALDRAVRIVNTYYPELLECVWFTTTNAFKMLGNPRMSFFTIEVTAVEDNTEEVKYRLMPAFHKDLLTEKME